MFTVTRISLIVYMLKCSYYRERELTLKTQVLIFDRYYDKSININYSLERWFKDRLID